VAAAATSGITAASHGADGVALLQQSVAREQAGTAIPIQLLRTFVELNKDYIEDLFTNITLPEPAHRMDAATSFMRKPGEEFARKIQRKLKQADELARAANEGKPLRDRPAEAKCQKSDRHELTKVPNLLVHWNGFPSTCSLELMFSQDNLEHRQKIIPQMGYCIQDLLHLSEKCAECGVTLMKGLWIGKGPTSEYCKKLPSYCQGLTPDEVNKPCGQAISHCMNLAVKDIDHVLDCVDVPYKWWAQRVIKGVEDGFEEGWMMTRGALGRILAKASEPTKVKLPELKKDGMADFLNPFGVRRRPGGSHTDKGV